MWTPAGETLSLVSRDAQVFKPQEGWCEMDMADLWVQLCRITAQLKEEAPEAFEAVAGIGITAQGDGLWAIDQAGEPVGRAMLWNDTRAKDLVLPHKAEIDQYLVEHHGTPVVVGSMPHLPGLDKGQPAGGLPADCHRLPLQGLAQLQADRHPRHRLHRRLQRGHGCVYQGVPAPGI